MTSLTRETFASRAGAVMTLIGVAVGLGNVWRFPYMVGQFGGAAFVLVYVAIVAFIGVPALMTELALGRHTRRGPVGAFAAGGLPAGRALGWFFFFVVTAAMAYYGVVVGWVLAYGVSMFAPLLGATFDASAVLPPASGFRGSGIALQFAFTAIVLGGCALVVRLGLRRGIERASTVIMPVLFAVLVLIVVRALTLPGAIDGVRWFVLKFSPGDVTASVVVAALGQAVFSLSLGGTFMVVYGSYLDARVDVRRTAILTAVGDTSAGLLAGFAIIPAVFAFGFAPTSGPTLLFDTIPRVFSAMPGGAVFGFLFFAALFGAAFLSSVAAVEVLVAGLTDNTALSRQQAVWVMAAAVLVLSIPPSINMRVFGPWDLTFGSGMQTLGALCAALTLGWCVKRADALAELSSRGEHPVPAWLLGWIRFGIPAAIISVGVWWVLTEVVGVMSRV